MKLNIFSTIFFISFACSISSCKKDTQPTEESTLHKTEKNYLEAKVTSPNGKNNLNLNVTDKQLKINLNGDNKQFFSSNNMEAKKVYIKPNAQGQGGLIMVWVKAPNGLVHITPIRVKDFYNKEELYTAFQEKEKKFLQENK